MKKSLSRITVFVLVMALITIFQKQTYGQLYLGFKAGAGQYKLTGSTYGGISYKFGLNGGAILGFKIKTDLNIQGEILYSQKGMQQQFSQEIIYNDQGPNGVPVVYDTTTKYNNKLTLSYLEIPVLFKKSFSFKGGIFPYRRDMGIVDFDLFIGPYFGYLLSPSASFSSLQSSRYTQNDSLISSTPEFENTGAHSFRIGQGNKVVTKDSGLFFLNPDSVVKVISPKRSLSAGLSKIDVGIIFGAGFSIEVSPKSKLFIDARYSMGLLSIDKTYFSNDVYTLKSGTKYRIGTQTFSATVIHNKLDLKNSGIVFNFGYIHYLK